MVKLVDLLNSNDTPKEAHKRLSKLLFQKGERFKKRHGNWIRLRIRGDYYLEMDSWNEAISICRGTGEPRAPDGPDVHGFKGKHLHYFGMDFGGHEVPPSQHIGIYHIYMAFYS